MAEIEASQRLNIHVEGGSTVGNVSQVYGARRSEPGRRADDRSVLLLIASDPYSRDRLRLDLEVRAVEDVLRSSGREDSLVLEQLWAPTFFDVQEALLRYRPTFLHFSGHGTPLGQLEFEKSPRLPNEGRRPSQSDQRTIDSFADLLRGIEGVRIRCLVLNACFSETLTTEVAGCVDCVIGLAAEVHDSAAVQFARGFYGGLAWGQSVQAAFDLGVAQVSSKNDASLYRLMAPTSDPRSVKML